MAEVKRIFIVNCKNCGATLRVNGGSKLYMCPVCRKLFTIPAQDQPKEEPAAPVTETSTEEKAVTNTPTEREQSVAETPLESSSTETIE